MQAPVRRNKANPVVLAAAAAFSSGAASAQDSLVIYHQLSETQIIPIRERFTEYYQKQTGKSVEFADFFQPGGQLQSTIILEARGDAVRADVIIIPPTR